jgi:hypothetical protein
MTTHLWTCPKCQNAHRAPSRPRKDDVRRFCLKCSEMTGRLVARVCGVLEKARELAVGKRKNSEQKKRERAAERAVKARVTERQRYVVAGVDLLDEAKRYWDVLCRSKWTEGEFLRHGMLVDRRQNMRERGHPQIVVRKTRHSLSGVWTRVKGVEAVVVRFSGDNQCDAAGVRELLLHELCHAALPTGTGHNMRFRKCLRDAAQELWGVEIDIIPTRHRYHLDDLITEELRKKLGLPPQPRMFMRKPEATKVTTELSVTCPSSFPTGGLGEFSAAL